MRVRRCWLAPSAALLQAMNYSPELVAMLSNHAAWAVMQLEAQLSDMLSDEVLAE